MNILGIDPGTYGAVVRVYDNGTRISGFPIPVEKSTGRGQEVVWSRIPPLWEDLLQDGVDHVYLERVQAMPRDGGSSAFKFGTIYGGLRGLIAAYRLPHTLVTPAVWTRGLKLIGGNKKKAILRAAELFPNDIDLLTPKRGERTQKHIEGIADAALIGYYGYRQLTKEHSE